MSTPRPKPIDKIAELISAKLAFTNGWGIPDTRYEDLCREVADEILKYLFRRKRTK